MGCVLLSLDRKTDLIEIYINETINLELSMKTKNRFTKALAVALIIGIGLIYNMNLKISMNNLT